MADRLSQLSNGQLGIKIYPNATLGNQRESTELLKAGVLNLVKINANELEPFSSLYGAFNLPYLFRDQTHYHKVLTGRVGELVLKSSGEKGFMGLAFYDAGARSFYGRKPIKTPSDIKGLKLRVQPGQTAIRMLETMGGSPVPIALGELYTAIQPHSGNLGGLPPRWIAYNGMSHCRVSLLWSYREIAITFID